MTPAAGLAGGFLGSYVRDLRPLGNVVYLFLPQAVTRRDLDDILDRFGETLRAVLR